MLQRLVSIAVLAGLLAACSQSPRPVTEQHGRRDRDESDGERDGRGSAQAVAGRARRRSVGLGLGSSHRWMRLE